MGCQIVDKAKEKWPVEKWPVEKWPKKYDRINHLGLGIRQKL